MSVRFIGQPFNEDAQIGRVLLGALGDPALSRLWIATAWAKQSGVSRIRSAVADFAAEGGTSEVVVGIDEGGATREGLQLCLELFDDVFVHHDPGARTFHPKIYAVESDDRAVLVVGSGNLTKGGLFTNYEAAFVLEAVRDDPTGWQARDDVRAYFNRLLAAGDAVRRLDEELIELLAAEGWVTSEARQNARRSAQSRERRDRQALFGGAVGGLAGAPAPEVAPLLDDEQDEDSALPPAPAPPAPPPVAPPPAPTVVETWSKELPATDAQHQVGSPTGNLRLTEADTGVDHTVWFRDTLFGPAVWAPDTDSRANAIEVATVTFDVTIAGVHFGQRNLVVDHGPHRIAGQRNHATILKWGPLNPVLRATDYTGRVVRLSRLSDGSYRLDIS